MSVLDNPRHERFAVAIAKGASGRDAYKGAGYSVKSDATADVNASRLLSDARVKGRVTELQERAAEKAEWTKADAIKRLIRLADRADTMDGPPAVSASRAALMDAARLSGWVVDRAEVGRAGDFERLNDTELDAFIAERARGVGGGADRAREASGTEAAVKPARRFN